MLILVFLLSGCAKNDNLDSTPQFMTYTIGESDDTLKSYIIQEYEQVDISEAYRQDRTEIESYRRYRAARNLADKEKEEKERLDCYKKEGKNETEDYIDECET